MKKLLFLFFSILSFAAIAQTGSISHSGIKLRVNDTTAYQSAVATAHAQGYSDIYWNNQATTPHWDIWNGSSYDHVFDFNAGGGGGGTWGSITGTLSSQTDLQNALNAKLPLTFTGDQTIATGGFWLRLQGTGTQIPMLALDAPNNIRKAIEFRTGNLARWQIHTENNETGSGNTGTDLHFERYDDAGAFIDAPFGIGRTDGVGFFNKAPTITTAPAAAANNTEVPTTAWVQTELANQAETLTVACSDETTVIVSGTNKIRFRMPQARTLTAIRASLNVGQTGGSVFTVDVNESGATILSTKLTFDNNETTTTTAATPAVISDSSLADDAEISIDVDQVGTGSPAGLKVTFYWN